MPEGKKEHKKEHKKAEKKEGKKEAKKEREPEPEPEPVIEVEEASSASDTEESSEEVEVDKETLKFNAAAAPTSPLKEAERLAVEAATREAAEGQLLTPRTAREEDELDRTTRRKGKLYIHVLGVTDLKRKGDVYYLVHLGKDNGKKDNKKNALYHSKVIHNTIDPDFNEGSKIFKIKPSDDFFKVSIWRHKQMGDEFLGERCVAIPDILDGMPSSGWVTLAPRKGREKKDKIEGDISMNYVFLEEDEAVEGHEFLYPLQTFVRKSRPDIVRRLLERDGGDKLEEPDGGGVLALYLAAESNLPDAVREMIHHGGKLDAASGELKRTALHGACVGSAESARLLIAKGADLAAKDKDGFAPIHVAAQNNQIVTLKLLLEKGADVNAKSGSGETPLHAALGAKAFLAVDFLVANGAAIYARTTDGLTPGDVAAKTDLETRHHLMAALKLQDFDEIATMEHFPVPARVQGQGASSEWKKSPQVAFMLPKEGERKVKATVLVHHDGEPDNCNLGFLVLPAVAGRRSVYKETTFVTLLAHGGEHPVEIEMDAGKAYVVIPYLKTPDSSGSVTVMVFLPAGEEAAKLTLLEDWRYSFDLEGKWEKGKTAGGCQNFKTWHQNPYFSAVLPKKEVEMTVMLTQQKNELNQLLSAASAANQFAVNPTPQHAGFYIFDSSVKVQLDQCAKWQNASDVVGNFVIDGEDRNKIVVVPTLFEPDQEGEFVLTVFTNAKIKFKPFGQ